MPQSALEIAKELTLALTETGRLSTEDMCDALQKIHAILLTLKAQEETGTTIVPVSATPSAPVDWRKSITKHTIRCLECGQTMKQLSRHHLMTHGLVGRSYRVKYSMPRKEPLAAREITARRKQIAAERRPWEHAPTYRRAQERDGKAPPEPEADALPNEIEASSAEAPAPAQPKRARKTTPKKAARKKRSEG